MKRIGFDKVTITRSEVYYGRPEGLEGKPFFLIQAAGFASGIELSLKGDVSTLKEANTVVKFLLQDAEFFVEKGEPPPA